MEFKDYYKVLGVDTTADNKTIKTAYRRLARKYHPDVSKANNAEGQFKAVAEAYEVLGKADKRAKYDQLKQARERPQQRGARSGQGASDQEFDDFFSSVFGGGAGAGGFGGGGGFRQQGFERQGFKRKGRDVEMEWPVMLEDTLSDKAQTIDFSIPTASGAPQPKTLKVRIPAGVGDGERIRLKGQGAPGTGSAPSGDLYLHIRLVPHPMFDVEGRNLVLTLPLAPWEAALGAKVTVPTLEGEVNLAIPKGSQAGQRLRLKGKGLSEKTDKSVRGDLLVQLRIVMPRMEGASDQADVEALWQQLSEKSQFDPRAQWRQPS